MGVAELTRNAVDVSPEGGLEAKLKLGRPLRVKLGIDVTAPDVTLGNGVPLQRMRAFQDEGHVGVLIVGDYTTRIGDPSGRSEKRPMLEPAVIDANAQRYFDQAMHDHRPASGPSFASTASGSRSWTSPSAAARADDDRRPTPRARRLREALRAKAPISVSELLYPLMQAYDSVASRPTSSSAGPTSSSTC